MPKYFYILPLLLILSFSVHAENLERRITQQTEDNVDIEIYHCTSCGFRARANMLAEEIFKEFGLKAELISGEIGSFDVYINGSLIFSKSEAMRFPKPGEIVQKIKKYMSIHELTNTQKDS